MADIVVSVPKAVWPEWLDEGDLPGETPGGAFDAYDFYLSFGGRPNAELGDRCYIVAHGRVRGYAPIVEVRRYGRGWSIVRQGGAEAVTIPDPVRGFRGWKERWWARAVETPFPDWKTEGVAVECDHCFKVRPTPYLAQRTIGVVEKRHRFVCQPCAEAWLAARRAKGIDVLADTTAAIEERRLPFAPGGARG